MENMESKRMENYFDKAKNLPVAMSIAEVTQLISAKGVTSPPQKSWWNLNNFIFMTTSILLISTAILTFQTSLNSEEKTTYNPKNKELTFTTLQDYSSDIQTNLTENDKNYVFQVEAKNDKNKRESNKTIAYDSLTEKTVIVEYMEPIEPMEPIAPVVEIEEPLESQLGGNFTGASKTLTKEMALPGITTLEFSHSNGNVEIETWNEDKIEVTATFTISAKEQEDELLAKNDFDFNLSASGFKVLLESNWDKINNCGCNTPQTTEPKGLKKLFYFPSKNKAKTDDGESFEYENFKIEYTIKIPKRLNIDVTNNYADVSVAATDGNLDATVFRGNLKAKDVGGDLKVKVNYGGALLGNYVEGNVTSFRSNIALGEGVSLKLKANYSEVTADKVNELNLNAFRSNLTLNSGLQQLKGSVKYGDFTAIGAIIDAELSLFRSNLKAPSFERLNLTLNYGSLKTEKVDELTIEEGFRSDIDVNEVGSITGKVNYSPLNIKVLYNELDVKSFRSNIIVDLVKADFSGITINAKYATINLNFSPEAKYELDAVTTYTEFKVPTEIMSENHQSAVTNNANHFVGVFNKQSSKATSLVNLETFQGELRLN